MLSARLQALKASPVTTSRFGCQPRLRHNPYSSGHDAATLSLVTCRLARADHRGDARARATDDAQQAEDTPARTARLRQPRAAEGPTAAEKARLKPDT